MTGGVEKIITIGTSAGALDALTTVLADLPAGLPVPILIVVHIPPDRESMLAEILSSKSALTVKEAEDKEPLKSGMIYIAPPDYHLLVEDNGVLSLSSDEPVLFSRPSIDVLFESAADAFGSDTVGIVLTGANPDGAKGARAIADMGGMVLVQSPDDAFAPEMPEAALKACPEARIMNLNEIHAFLQKAAV